MLQLLQYDPRTTDFDRPLFVRVDDIESITTVLIDRGRRITSLDRYVEAARIRLRSGRKHTVAESVESIAAACGAFGLEAVAGLQIAEVA
jgi:hypothetical protein